VLRFFLLIAVTNFAVRGEAHLLKPRSNRETLVESDPNESAHFPRAWFMLDSGDHLWRCRVTKVLFWINGIRFCKKVNYFVLDLIRSCIHCNMDATSLNTLGKMLNIVLGI
jgi:hypothetical protein